MYETPKLNRVGQAEDVILGTFPSGDDLDTNIIVQDMVWADDGDDVTA